MGGAASMICAGALEGVDMCCGLHVNAMAPVGTVAYSRGRAAASSDRFELTVHGRGGHGGSPHEAIDPTLAAAEIIQAYSALPAREFSPLENCVVGIGTINTDSSWNIVPDWVRISGGVRTFNLEVRERICKRLEEIAQGICAAHRCTAEFVRHVGYMPMICDADSAEFMRSVAAELLGENAVIESPPTMGSEDMGYYLQKVPGAFMMVGIHDSQEKPYPQHSPYFRVPLDSLGVGVLLHINNAMEFLKR